MDASFHKSLTKIDKRQFQIQKAQVCKRLRLEDRIIFRRRGE